MNWNYTKRHISQYFYSLISIKNEENATCVRSDLWQLVLTLQGIQNLFVKNKKYYIYYSKITIFISKFVLFEYSDAICLLFLSKHYDFQLHAQFVTKFFSQCIINTPITITQIDFIWNHTNVTLHMKLYDWSQQHTILLIFCPVLFVFFYNIRTSESYINTKDKITYSWPL